MTRERCLRTLRRMRDAWWMNLAPASWQRALYWAVTAIETHVPEGWNDLPAEWTGRTP